MKEKITSKKFNLKKTKIFIILSVCLGIILVFSFCTTNHTEYYYKYKYLQKRGDFDPITYSTIDYKCSKEEKEEVAGVMETAKKVFTYTGSEKDADKNVGELSRYYIFSAPSYEIDHVNLKLDLITAKVRHNSGFMWVVYSDWHCDSQGNKLSGSDDILCYWKIKKINGKWTVVKIKEAV